MGMDYSRAADWIVAEDSFDPEHLGKCESIMCQGNGYLCLRNATDEFNPGEQRDLFVAGTFNKFDADEVTELPNAADVSRLDLRLDGVRFSLLTGKVESYDRALDLKTGETVRRVVWAAKVWDNVPVTIQAADPFDQMAIRFAQYHLYVMTPAHDNRMNVGAKGLSGEGYKGHTFWDTEMFVLPYFIYSDPAIARSLEEYRWLSLPGAHKKAAANNYQGAQFPWEAAWIDDGEVTPVWGAADIVTGLPTKIWSGFIEQHITADVAYGAWEYHQATGDQDFMDRCGYELILDTGKFWASRLEEGDDGRLHINDVVGPDEYKEHVDDNAFTNYMAAWNIRKALEYSRQLKAEKPDLYRALDAKLGLAALEPQWEEKLSRLYLPQPREDLVIPQDRTYLTLKDIDLTKYKNQQNVGSIYRDYNQEQITHMQVSKQADILIMFLLLEDEFSAEVKRANWSYYEPRTLHDSSLSLSTHCILASDMGSRELAYQLFRSAAAIDVGPNMKTSDAGIHAGSLAGVWQSVVFGFGGVRMLDGKLRIDPALPDAWTSLDFYLYWHGQKLHVTLTHDAAVIENLTAAAPVTLTVGIWGGNDQETAAINQLKDNFEADHGCTVELKVYTDFNTQFQADLIGQTAPDCFYIDGVMFPFFGSLGVMDPLDPAEYELDAFYPNLVEAFTNDQGTLCVPKDVSSLATYYNIDLLEACGYTASIINTAYQNYFPLAVNGEMTAAEFLQAAQDQANQEIANAG